MHWVSGQALLVVLFCLPAALIVQWILQRRKSSSTPLSLPPWILAPMGCFILFASAGPALTAASGRVIYHDEPTVISVASAELHGEPLYHSPTAAARYSLL